MVRHWWKRNISNTVDKMDLTHSSKKAWNHTKKFNGDQKDIKKLFSYRGADDIGEEKVINLGPGVRNWILLLDGDKKQLSLRHFSGPHPVQPLLKQSINARTSRTFSEINDLSIKSKIIWNPPLISWGITNWIPTKTNKLLPRWKCYI